MTANTEEKNELIVFNDIKPIEVFSAEKGLDPIIKELRDKVNSEVYDVTTKAGRARMRSVSAQVGSSRVQLEKMAKALTENWRAQTKAVTSETSRMTKELNELRDEVKRPAVEFDAKEDKRIADHNGALADLAHFQNYAVYDDNHEPSDATTIEGYIQTSRDFFIERDWEEFESKAKTQQEKNDLVLTQALSAKVKADHEAAELKRLQDEEAERKQKERDEAEAEIKIISGLAVFSAEQDIDVHTVNLRVSSIDDMNKDCGDHQSEVDIAKTASLAILRNHLSTMKKAAEDRIADKKNADQVKKTADEKAAKDLAAEKQETTEKAGYAAHMEREKASVAKWEDGEATRLREADKAHRAKINNESLEDLQKVIDEGINGDDPMKDLVKAIAKGEIRHVKINY